MRTIAERNLRLRMRVEPREGFRFVAEEFR